MRQKIDDITENQKGKKSHNDHGNKFHGQYVSEILNALEIKQDTIENNENTDPENETDRGVHEDTYPVISLTFRPQAIDSGMDTRSEKSKNGIHRKVFSLIKVRNTSSSLASPRLAIRFNSSRVPSANKVPLWINPMR